MALFQSAIYSQKLMLCTNVNVILSLPNVSNMEEGDQLRLPAAGEHYQVLWLLHCGTGDHNEFLRFTRIEEYAQKKQLAVVMPDAGNSYYCNLPYGGKYFDYYTEELPQIMQAIFPLSAKKEHNFIGGTSMGGFGAFAAALRKPQQYAAAFSLSGGLDFRNVDFGPGLEEIQRNMQFTVCGDQDQYYDPHAHDLACMADDLLASGAKQPLLYAANGTDDPITKEISPGPVAALRAHGLDITYLEESGAHGWDFWDPQLRRVLDWLPLADGFVD